MRTKGSWAYSLQSATSLPTTGERHPLRKEATRWLSWSNAFTLLVAAAIFLTWYIWSRREVDEAPSEVQIVNIVDIGIPPPIDQPTTPQMNIPNVAPPSIGVPEPVPEMLAEAQTIATQTEMSVLTAITVDDLGGGGGRDSIVVARAPEATIYTQTFDENPIRLSIDPPRYPDLAREAGVEGTIVIKVYVGKDGSVKKAVHESGGPEMLVIPAMECAKTAKFRPALMQNKPVEVWVRMPIVFTLSGS